MNSIEKSEKHILEAEEQIVELEKQIGYDTKDYTIEHIVNKFIKEEFVIPSYQRNFIWNDKYRSAFIESIFLGLPIPFMFFSACKDGNYEIIDGAQRVQTLVAFVDGGYMLKKLNKLDKLNELKFEYLDQSRRKKFLNKSIRVVVLDEDTPDDVRRDLFYRINTYGLKANTSEIRKGSSPKEFVEFIDECSKMEKFIDLTPMSNNKIDRYERFELILRFFAILNEYDSITQDISTFLDDYILHNNTDLKNNKDKYEQEFINMINFVKDTFPNGFCKSSSHHSIQRVRFEAISVGVALALRKNPKLHVKNVDWINSKEFEEYTVSHASCNINRRKKRIEYVRDNLLSNNLEQ